MNKQGEANLNDKLHELNHLQEKIAQLGDRMKASRNAPLSEKWAIACQQNAAEMSALLGKHQTCAESCFPTCTERREER
jgi:hypothetical protein